MYNQKCIYCLRYIGNVDGKARVTPLMRVGGDITLWRVVIMSVARGCFLSQYI